MQKNLISTVLNDTLLGLWSPQLTHCACMSSRGHKPVFIDHFCRDEGHHWALVTL